MVVACLHAIANSDLPAPCRLDALRSQLVRAKDVYREHPLPDTRQVVATYGAQHSALVATLEEVEYAISRGSNTELLELPRTFGKELDTLATELQAALQAYLDARLAHTALQEPVSVRRARASPALERLPAVRFVQHDATGGLVDQVVGALLRPRCHTVTPCIYIATLSCNLGSHCHALC